MLAWEKREDVRRVEHLVRGQFERGAGTRGSGGSRRGAEAGTGQRAVRGRRDASAGASGAGVDRRVREFGGASQTGRPRAHVVRGAVEVRRLEAGEPAGVRLWSGCNTMRPGKTWKQLGSGAQLPISETSRLTKAGFENRPASPGAAGDRTQPPGAVAIGHQPRSGAQIQPNPR